MVEPGRDSVYRDTSARLCGRQRVVATGNGSTRLAARLVMMRKPAPLPAPPLTELEVAEEQGGFRPQRDMHNHLCSLRILTEKARSRQQLLYM